VALKSSKELVNSKEEAIVYYTLVLESGDLMFSTGTFLVNLVLFCANEGLLVDIRVYLDI
jgi:hypothetical protein